VSRAGPAIGVLLLTVGCSSAWVRPEPTPRALRTVAVLPLLPAGDVADDDLGAHRAEMLTTIVTGRMAAGPYLLMPPHTVEHRLRAAGLETPRAVREASPEALHGALGVDFVVRGDLTEDLHVQVGVVHWRSVECRLEAIDLRDGYCFSAVEGFEVDFSGVLLELGQPFEGLVDAVDSHDDESFVRVAEWVVDDLVRALPEPPTPPEIEVPVIRDVRWELPAGVDATRPLGPGHALTVSLRGDPGHVARLDLGGGRRLQLPEVEPGHYRGACTVMVGDRCAAPSVTLTAATGAASARPLGLEVDARPPRAVRALHAAACGERVVLGWEAPPDAANEALLYVVHARRAGGELEELRRAPGYHTVLPRDPRVVGYLVSARSEAGTLGPSRAVAAPGASR